MRTIGIVSGEGEHGTWERYAGKQSERAIKSRLRRERCGGDRWARAYEYEYQCEDGSHLWREIGGDRSTIGPAPEDLR